MYIVLIYHQNIVSFSAVTDVTGLSHFKQISLLADIEIHFRFGVAVATAIADSRNYDKKRKAA